MATHSSILARRISGPEEHGGEAELLRGSRLQRDTHSSIQFSRVRLFATPWTAVHQASLSITTEQLTL